MRSATIIADGGIDLPVGFAETFGIRTLPLMLSFGGEHLRSGVDITAQEFYRRLRQDKQMLPTTSMPSVGDYVDMYKAAAEEGLPILSFHLSKGLSGSYNSARTAREMLPELDIRLVDTGTLSGAMGMQVLVAATMARRGVPVDEIIRETERIHRESDTFYTVDTLEYLRKGGRIGKVSGFVGSLLGIRPIITVDKAEGIYTGAGRARSFRQAVSQIVDLMVEQAGEGATVSCMVLHGDCEPEVERMLDRMKARLNVQWVKVLRVNPSLGSHIGPDAIGVAYYRGLLPIGEVELVEQAIV